MIGTVRSSTEAPLNLRSMLIPEAARKLLLCHRETAKLALLSFGRVIDPCSDHVGMHVMMWPAGSQLAVVPQFETPGSFNW